MVFAAIYGGFLVLALRALGEARGPGPLWRGFALALPLAASLADWAENLLLLRVLAALPAERHATLRLAARCTQVKFLALAFTLWLLVATPVALWM